MGFKAARCPNCSGELSLDPEYEMGFCMHCGSKIFVKEALEKVRVEGVATIRNLYDMAENSKKIGKYKEAYNYYSKALELDPKNYILLYKRSLVVGIASGFCQDDEYIVNEFFEGIKLSLEYVPPDKKDAFKEKIGEDILNITYESIKRHISCLYGREGLHLSSSWSQFWVENIISALEMAALINPPKRQDYLKMITTICPYGPDQNEINATIGGKIEKYEEEYKNYYDSNYITWKETIIKWKENIPPRKSEKELNKLSIEHARKLDKKRKTERRENEKGSGACFIATAVYDDYNAPEVLILRNFRDKYLNKYLLTRFLVQIYYRFSPVFAKRLQSNIFLRGKVKKILDRITEFLNQSDQQF